MRWWQKLFNQKNKHQKIKTTGQLNATHVARKSELPVVVAPVTGQLQKIDNDGEQIHNKNGFMMLPDGNNIMSPVAGIVGASDEQFLTIQSAHYHDVVVQLKNEETNSSRLATYSKGQQLHAGDLIGVAHATSHNVRVYVLFEESIVPQLKYGSVYAGQNVWQYQEDATHGEK
ncbi:PTS sugar transporter subunit IIA [Leuconostoc rapi]|uniref:PTS sugar transporter subunit IIA n=1 Tax=Leuconostoc rapi TaxID=1406906 RepID=UPI00195B0FB3|nr:PTS sugar transporter subunit IIA [Leuconostoc rapi]MBM7435647.1 hypothetical protein [Leuconostoc rapi]